MPQDSAEKVYLFFHYGSDLEEIDSAQVNEKGGFKFQLPHTLQQGLYKIGFGLETLALIILSYNEKNIIIKTDFEGLKAGYITVINSRENDAYGVLKKELIWFANSVSKLKFMKNQISPVDHFFRKKGKDIDNKVKLLIQEFNRQLSYIKEGCPNTFTAEVLTMLLKIPQMSDQPEFKNEYDNESAFLHDHFFDFIDFTDERVIYTPLLEQKYYIYLDEYTHHTLEGFKDSVDMIFNKAMANDVVMDFTIINLIDLFNEKGPEELVDYVIGKIDSHEQGCVSSLSEVTVERIESLKRLRVGQMALDVVSQDPDGNPVALSSLIGQNVSMLYFWASWCSICDIENPNLVRIYNKYKDKGFKVYAVALESDKEEWFSAIKKHQLTWINVSDMNAWESECAVTYNIRETQTTYLFDKEGRIIAKDLNSYELEIKLEDILN